MKWSELDELVVDAALIAVEQEGINPAILQRELGIEYGRAGRLVDQLETLKIVTPNSETEPRRSLFSKVEAVRVYLNELRSLEEFTQADIDRYNYMRSVDHWKEYEDPLLALNFLDDELSGEEIFSRLMNGNDSSVVERFQPQLAFKRSTFQRILYSTRAVGAILVGVALMLVVFRIEICYEWVYTSDLRVKLFQIGLLIVSFLGSEPFWSKHLRTPRELYWVGDHFEAVFPDGTLDPLPYLNGVEFSGGKFKREDWLTLVPANGYFGANGRQLVKIHQAWKNAQKEE
jgi:hypothetical protein